MNIPGDKSYQDKLFKNCYLGCSDFCASYSTLDFLELMRPEFMEDDLRISTRALSVIYNGCGPKQGHVLVYRGITTWKTDVGVLL